MLSLPSKAAKSQASRYWGTEKMRIAGFRASWARFPLEKNRRISGLYRDFSLSAIFTDRGFYRPVLMIIFDQAGCTAADAHCLSKLSAFHAIFIDD